MQRLPSRGRPSPRSGEQGRRPVPASSAVRIPRIVGTAQGVHFSATQEGVQPDILFVSNERRGIIAPDELEGAPDFVVEILSPSTATRGRDLKRRTYQRQGVAGYWVVDPDANAVDVWRFGDESRSERYVDSVPVRLGTERLSEIDLADGFAEG